MFLLIFLTLTLTFNQILLTDALEDVENKDEIKKEDLDERINLSFDNAHADAIGPGGYSSSDAHNSGIDVGIVRPGFGYRPLYSNHQAGSNSYNNRRPGYFGPGPNTYAYTRRRPYGPGMAGAGFNGGIGNTYSNSYNNRIAVPIGPFGTTLLSNFNEEDDAKNETIKTTKDGTIDEKDEAIKIEKEKEEILNDEKIKLKRKNRKKF